MLARHCTALLRSLRSSSRIDAVHGPASFHHLRIARQSDPPPSPVTRGSNHDSPNTIQSSSKGAREREAADAERIEVWWDASCPLCTKEISLLKRLDAKRVITFNAITAASPDRIHLSPPRSASPPPSLSCESDVGQVMDKKTLLGRFHARRAGAGENLVSGAAAFAMMWRVVPNKFLNFIGDAALSKPSVLWVLERLYRGFLLVRPSMQRFARWVG